MVRIENLTKYYGKNRAVNHISFDIGDNEILGFLGPNGAGKTTTMNMIAGYLPMTGGNVSVCGIDISKDPVKAKKNIGYLPEVPPVYPDMKVREYLRFCAELKKIPRDKRKEEIERVSELLKISDMSSRLIKNLSKGYRQRVGFAQALLGDPKFLILDEPTVGLDPNQVIEVRNIITDLKKDHSVIFSSHILSEVSAVCDRVVIINKGDIKAIDTIDNLESSFEGRLVLNVKVTGNKDRIIAVSRDTEGITKILEVTPEGENMFDIRLQTQGDTDTIRNSLMAALIAAGVTIREIFTEKPNLEDVFIKIVNRPAARSSLSDILAEMDAEALERGGEKLTTDDGDDNDNDDDGKEED